MVFRCGSVGPVLKDPTQVLLGLGSNLGDRADTVNRALNHLGALPSTRLVAISPAVESDPIGPPGQGPYLNLTAALSTQLEPQDLLAAVLAIENQLGRVRTVVYGARTCDIDLLFFSGFVSQSPALTLPHPRWRERPFVVEPLRYLLELGEVATWPGWDELRSEVQRLPRSQTGLRKWTGTTPWLQNPT